MNNESLEHPPLSDDDRMHLLLGRFIHAFGRLDFSVGLQLNWLGPYRGVDVKELLIQTTPFSHRLRVLEPLVLDVYCDTDEQAKKEFLEWFDRAKGVRVLRNELAHGRWSIQQDRERNSIQYLFVPLSWELDPDKLISPINFTHDELNAVVTEVESLARDYFKLEDRYRHLAKPSAEWERKWKTST